MHPCLEDRTALAERVRHEAQRNRAILSLFGKRQLHSALRTLNEEEEQRKAALRSSAHMTMCSFTRSFPCRGPTIAQRTAQQRRSSNSNRGIGLLAGIGGGTPPKHTQAESVANTNTPVAAHPRVVAIESAPSSSASGVVVCRAAGGLVGSGEFCRSAEQLEI